MCLRRAMLLKRAVGGKLVDDCECVFHQFSIEYEEFADAPPVQFPVAIIEMSDGTVRLANAALIRFLDSPSIASRVGSDG